ncbi:hypothetical protein PINS_up007833 [Pythium insidiosum]|nr:hypothetical protein PINS_up007833 [Pythium insidiosum]
MTIRANFIRHVIESLALPLPIVQTILQFTVDDDDFEPGYRVEMYPYLPTFPVTRLKTLRQVSRRWAQTIDQLYTEHQRRVFVFAIKTGSDDERQAFAQALSRRGNDLRALVLVAGEYGRHSRSSFTLFREFPNISAFDAIPFDWNVLLQQCPRLERLDLTFLPLSSKHVVSIINAASQHCLGLQALLLPKREVSWSVPSWELTEPMMDTLYAAVIRWGEVGNRGGLRQLSWPERPFYQDAQYIQDRADEILELIGAYAPNLEYLDGWITSYSEDPSLYTNELLFSGLDAWTYFCEHASNLAELNWFVLPFVDCFFQAFGRFKQTNLKVLTLAAGDHCNFPDFMTNGSYFKDDAWTFSSDGLCAVPRACPALQELRIIFQREDADLEARQDAFDDAFLESVAVNCLALRTLYLAEHWTGQDVVPMRNITDRGIVALSQLPELTRVSLKATQCTSRGVLGLLFNSPLYGAPRVVDISFMPTAAGPSFHDVVLEVVTALLDQSAALMGRRFALKLENWHSVHKEVRVEVLQLLRERSAALMRADAAFRVMTDSPEDDDAARLDQERDEDLAATETVYIRFGLATSQRFDSFYTRYMSDSRARLRELPPISAA